MSSIEINFKYNNIGRMKVKGLKKVCKQQPKESRHGCINIRKSRLQNKENYQRTLYNYKRAIHQKDTATLNTYAPNRGAKPKNQNLKGKRQIHKQTWRLQHPVSTTDRITRQKTSARVWKDSSTSPTNRIQVVFIEHSPQPPQNAHSFQVLMEHLQGHKANLNKLKEAKPYGAYSLVNRDSWQKL